MDLIQVVNWTSWLGPREWFNFKDPEYDVHIGPPTPITLSVYNWNQMDPLADPFGSICMLSRVQMSKDPLGAYSLASQTVASYNFQMLPSYSLEHRSSENDQAIKQIHHNLNQNPLACCLAEMEIQC
jgi:hypothetical protein